jgi:chromosome segregation ATPase
MSTFKFSRYDTAWESLSDLTRYINEHHTEHAKSLLELTIYVKALEEGEEELPDGPLSAIDQLAEIKTMLTEALETVNLFGEREKEFEESRVELVAEIRKAQQETLSAKADTVTMIAQSDSLKETISRYDSQIEETKEGQKSLHDLLRNTRQEKSLAEAKQAKAEIEAIGWKKRATSVKLDMQGKLRESQAYLEEKAAAAEEVEEWKIQAETWKTRAVNFRKKYKDATTNKKEDTSTHEPIPSKDAPQVPSQMVA